MKHTAKEVLRRYNARQRTWAVISAWMGGHVSEKQASILCNFTPVELRECAEEYRVVADALWDRYRSTGETISADIRSEVRHEMRHGGD